MTSSLYKLNCSREERRYEGFALSPTIPSVLGGESLLEDITPGIRRAGISTVEMPKFKDLWKPPQVTGKVSPKHDCPGINLTHPAFSARACEQLEEFFGGNGELLLLATPVGEFYFYNITTIIDAVDRERSSCTCLPTDPLRVVDIDYYVFREELVKGKHIFRAFDISSNVIVSQQFVDKVIDTKLKGFSFTKMWPHPPGTKWRLTGEILT